MHLGRGTAMHDHSWLLIFGVFIGLQLPLGILLGSFCSAGEDEDGLFPQSEDRLRS